MFKPTTYDDQEHRHQRLRHTTVNDRLTVDDREPSEYLVLSAWYWVLIVLPHLVSTPPRSAARPLAVLDYVLVALAHVFATRHVS